ncbi:hypothetical protein LCGC14_0382740 [marine sediment metagenome]|uniref:Uncharacterized protein n=1 Tax=marine sediment metagenome TaxID=412755 RepID=A0A0F9T1W2_9ZZZZ
MPYSYVIAPIIGDGTNVWSATTGPFRSLLSRIEDPGSPLKTPVVKVIDKQTGALISETSLPSARPHLSYVSVIPSNPVTGRPLFPWCLCFVHGMDFSALDDEPRIDDVFTREVRSVLPTPEEFLILLESTQVGQLSSRLAAISRAQRLGVEIEDVDSCYALVERLGKSLSPEFTLEGNLVRPT